MDTRRVYRVSMLPRLRNGYIAETYRLLKAEFPLPKWRGERMSYSGRSLILDRFPRCGGYLQQACIFPVVVTVGCLFLSLY